MNKPAVLYTTTTCSQCKKVKQFLAYKGIPFTEHNIEGDEEAIRLIRSMTGRTQAPTLHIGKRWMVGYKPTDIMEAVAE